jgi:hypothetical protein
MSEISLQPEKISILEFKIIKGQLESPFDFDIDSIIKHNFNVNYNVGFNVEERLAKVDFIVEIETESGTNQQEASGLFHFAFVYQVENMDELVEEEEEVVVHPYLHNALASITYSTSRGILMTRFKGTALENFILPVVDPNTLLESFEE